MDIPKYACDECCRNRSVLHQWKKQDGVFRNSSFFKIMFGKKIADELSVPPKFARTLEPFVGEKFCFEDSSGLKWHSILADLDHSLGFQKGWRKFFGDHDIKIGDLVEFHYVKKSYFQVKIYSRTGCQKVFSDDRTEQEKGHKFNGSFIPKRVSRNSIHVRSMLKRSFNTYAANAASDSDVEVIPRPKILEKGKDSPVPVRNNSASKAIISEKHELRPAVDPTNMNAVVKPSNADLVVKPSNMDPMLELCFMTNRDTISIVEDDIDRLIDLSTLEMPCKKPTSDRENSMRLCLDKPFFETPENGPESFDRKAGRSFYSDMPFETPENEPDANEAGKSQGNTSSQVPDTLQYAQTDAVLTNTIKCQIPEENTEVQSDAIKVTCAVPAEDIDFLELPKLYL